MQPTVFISRAAQPPPRCQPECEGWSPPPYPSAIEASALYRMRKRERERDSGRLPSVAADATWPLSFVKWVLARAGSLYHSPKFK